MVIRSEESADFDGHIIKGVRHAPVFRDGSPNYSFRDLGEVRGNEPGMLERAYVKAQTMYYSAAGDVAIAASSLLTGTVLGVAWSLYHN